MTPTPKAHIRIATRASRLALWQAEFIANQLNRLNVTTELVPITTKGDKILDRALHEVGGKGLFVKEVETLLLNHDADIAVHSLKDMPVALPDQLFIAATPQRHSIRDRIIFREDVFKTKIEKLSGDFSAWPSLRIGTSSLRRRCQLRKFFDAPEVTSLRGNVDTRLAKLKDPKENLDAILLAEASLERLDIDRAHTIPLESDQFIPCAAQGCLAIEMRKDDELVGVVSQLNDNQAAYEVHLERQVLAWLGGDCTMPAGISAHLHNETVQLQVSVLNHRGQDSYFSGSFNKDTNQEDIVSQAIHSLIEDGLEEVYKDLNIDFGAVRQ